jgi:hypothetical protein
MNVELHHLEKGASLALEAVEAMHRCATVLVEKTEGHGKDGGLLEFDDNHVFLGGPKGVGTGRTFWMPRYQMIFARGCAGDAKKARTFNLNKVPLPERILWFGVAFRLADKWCPKLVAGGYTKIKPRQTAPKKVREALGGLLLDVTLKGSCLQGQSAEVESLQLTGSSEIIVNRPLLAATTEEQLDSAAIETVNSMTRWWNSEG